MAPNELDDLGGVMDVSVVDGQARLSGDLSSAQLIVVLKLLDEREIKLVGLARHSLVDPVAANFAGLCDLNDRAPAHHTATAELST